MFGAAHPFSRYRMLICPTLSRFKRERDGSTAIEFGFVALPFLALLFAIIETALVFFVGQAIETGVADAARLVMTGQAQQAKWGSGAPGTDATLGQKIKTFRCEICSRAGPLINCNDLKLDVRKAGTFAGADPSVPIEDGAVDASGFGFDPGGPGDIMVIRAIYEYPVYVTLLNQSFANLSGSKRLLVGTAVFSNEPFPPAAPGTPPSPPPAVTPDCDE